MRQAGRVDSNQAEIVQALRDVGCSVVVLSNVGQGCADIACGYGGETFFFEIKSKGGKLTEAEQRFMDGWRGHYAVIYSVEDALRMIGVVDG